MTGQCLPPLAAVILIESFYKGRLALVPHLPLVQLLQSDLQSSCTMDLALWRRVAKAQSLDTLPELEFFWKQYDAESFSAPRHHPRNADTVAVLSQASAQCLTLLLQAQLASDAECKPLVMPSDAVAVTKVRMTLHILAHFISNWTAALSAVSNQQQSGSMSNMDQAVKEAGLIPLLQTACSAMAAGMQLEQQQQQQQPAQSRPSGAPLPYISLAGEVLNLWKMLVHAFADASSTPTPLSHDLLSPSVGACAELALAVLRNWDGSRPSPADMRPGKLTTIGILGEETNTTTAACWEAGIMSAAGVADVIADAYNKEVGREAAKRQGQLGHSSDKMWLCSNRAVNEAMSVPAVNQLLLFHLCMVSQVVHKQWNKLGQQQRQDQMQVHKELFTGLGMPAIAASAEPAVGYTGLDKLHVLIALQAAYNAGLLTGMSAGLALHCAAAWGVQAMQESNRKKLGVSAIPAGLHGIVAQLVQNLLCLCAPYKGVQELKILTNGLKMVGLVLVSDAAMLQRAQRILSDSSGLSTNTITPSTSTSNSSSVSPQALAAAVMAPLVLDIGPLCRKGQADHPTSAQLFPPMSWEQLFAAEEGGELLPLFGGLLRDLLLVMPPAESAAALSAACHQKPAVAAQTLEWVLRGCFRVEAGNMSYRSCGAGKPEGRCTTELKGDTTNVNVQRELAVAAAAARAHSEAAAAPGATPTGPLGFTPAAAAFNQPPFAGISSCYNDGLGSLVLLVHRVVLGVTAGAPWSQLPPQLDHAVCSSISQSSSAQQQDNSDAEPTSTSAGKHQVAALNTCLKLLNRLAVPPGDDDSDPDTEELLARDDGSGHLLTQSRWLTPAAKWVACQAAAAIASFGCNLADSAADSSSSSRHGRKLSSAGLSLAARGLLFVSQHMQEGCSSEESQPAEQQQLVDNIMVTCAQQQGALSELPSEGRSSLTQLHEQAQSLLERFAAQREDRQHTGSAAQLLMTLAGDLQQFITGAAAQLPASFGCNNTDCVNLWEGSELTIATSKCSSCKCAYFCSKTCQAAYWKHHKEACLALKSAAA